MKAAFTDLSYYYIFLRFKIILVFELMQAIRRSYTPLLMLPIDCFVTTHEKGCSLERYALIDIAAE